jgi:hypothetical protein
MTGPSLAECPVTAELRELLSGQLSPDRAEAVEEHVESCPICLAHLAVLPVEGPLIQAIRKGLPEAAPLSAELSLFDEHLVLVLAENGIAGIPLQDLEASHIDQDLADRERVLSLEMSRRAQIEDYAPQWEHHESQQRMLAVS